ncbi:MAG: segregation protein B [Flavobacteriaceae bacterium]|nr:segregation protein B [Flavobacteriaceae bacterium]|tara:strand:- start:4641 stop:5285 length:645 start_codon:yes stop_codon:yes gene_type:complete
MQVSIFGGTGLIGGFLVELLTKDPDFHLVNLITRKKIKINNEKVKIILMDFSNKDSISKSVENSSVVFSAIGTTRSKVKGDQKKYREIDLDINLNIAKACKEKNVEHFSFVSSSGANYNSKNFYLKLKGEIENSIINLKLDSLSILRPSLLIGKRNEIRIGEKIAQLIIPLFSFLMPLNYRPIKAYQVAKAMINISKNKKKGTNIYHYKQIQLN